MKESPISEEGEVQLDRDFVTKLRHLGENYYGNHLYGEHLEYQHKLQDLIKTYAQKEYQEGELKGKLDELESMLNGFYKGLEGKDADYRYIMRPIVSVIENRIKELKSQLERKEQ